MFEDRLRLLSRERDHFRSQVIIAQNVLGQQTGKLREQLIHRANVIFATLTPCVGVRVHKDESSQPTAGVPVIKVRNGSSAFLAGIRASYIILAVNGAEITSPSSLMQAFEKIIPGDLVTCMVKNCKNEVETLVIQVKPREMNLDFKTGLELRRIASGVVSFY